MFLTASKKSPFKKAKIGNTISEVAKLKRKEKNKSNPRKIILIGILAILVWIFIFYLYTTYKNIEVNPSNYEATKIQSTKSEQTVEKVEEESKKVADIIEETTRKVVGISKLKNAGNSILSKSTESELGLGTGMIVTEDGYILSNEHVTGEKYSKCYITLENGNNYDGTVVWSDSDLDLSITKINAKNLEYITLGDSSQIRVGETVYAIRKPHSDSNLEEPLPLELLVLKIEPSKLKKKTNPLI